MKNTPLGVMDLVQTEAKAHQKQITILDNFFKKNNFDYIRTPTIEYAESLSPGMSDALKEKSIQFIDPAGKVLMLRPEHTTPVARMVANRLKEEPLPLKLFYINPVFQKPDHNEKTEIFKAGCEFIGNNSLQTDIDMIDCCYQSLISLGYDDIGIDIGHTDYTKGLPSDKRNSLIKGDYISFGMIPPRGGAEVANGNRYMEQLYHGLSKKSYSKHIFINKGLVKEHQYYTGIVFEAYVKGIREVVASGGRYDQLLKLFGYDQSAIGFAINLSVLRDAQL